MKKKGTILLLGLIVILGGWWVLNNEGSQAQPSDGVIDVWATWGDDPEQLQALFDGYGASSATRVQVTTRVRSDDLLDALASAEPPDLVILSTADLVASYDVQGLVEPLDRWIGTNGIDLSDIYPAPLAQCEGPGESYLCLPWGCDVDALFWNKELFAAAGLDPDRPPQTIEELIEYANKLTVRDADGRLIQAGFIPDLTRSHLDLYVHMFGGAFYNTDGTGNESPTVDGESTVAALTWEREFYTLYDPEKLKDLVSSFTPYMDSKHPIYAGRRLDCRQCHRSAPIANGKTPDVGFSQSRVAMMIDGQWQAYARARAGEGAKMNYGVAPFPPSAAHLARANTTVAQGPVVFIPVNASDKEAAAELLAWMMSPPVLAEAANAHSALPTSRAASQDARFAQIPEFSMFLDLLAHPGTTTRTTPITPEFNEALSEVEEQVLHRDADLLSSLRAVQGKVTSSGDTR